MEISSTDKWKHDNAHRKGEEDIGHMNNFFYYIINSLIPKQRFVLKCFMKISMKYYPVITEKAIRE